MRCEVVAVGTGLLLGQGVDTSSPRLGEPRALARGETALVRHAGTAPGLLPSRYASARGSRR